MNKPLTDDLDSRKTRLNALPSQRWQIATSNPEEIDRIAKTLELDPLVVRVLVNRGIETPQLAHTHINPESQTLPLPLEEFPDLAKSVELLKSAIALKSPQKIAICGDYDADGMTSTALLLRALKHFGANVEYAIPSRMKDGYGINIRIVEEFAAAGVGLILTVDNGISAYEAIARAKKLGMNVIITDHHDLPEKLPPADAILNPKLISETSPYRGMAGVGVAYILAVTTAQSLGMLAGLTNQLLELFTLGTIADLAPLVGVNRRWLKRGLRRILDSQIVGVQALMAEAGINEQQKQMHPDDIGFKLGPRINAIGRIGDPQIIIELLTTEDAAVALFRAKQCEEVNRQRQQLCEQIEKEAIALVEETPIKWKEARVLVVVQHDWHHGVIGIVASRLVERYGVPVFIGTFEEEDENKIRGSARGIQEFHVFEALDFCGDLLGKYGGHKAAGGFSLPASNLDAFKQRLSNFAHQYLDREHLKPLVKIDAIAEFDRLNFNLYKQIDSLHPWGIGNEFPVFWTPNVIVKEQKTVGKNHLKLTLAQANNPSVTIKAVAWRWGEYSPLPTRLDIAYKLKQNCWRDQISIELEIAGARLPVEMQNLSLCNRVTFEYQERIYTCSLQQADRELKIENDRGGILCVSRGQKIGFLGTTPDDLKAVDCTQPHYYQLIKTALSALGKTA
ncbi:MAG: single-stranded-DNA-specific exonuclease RecJ [Xenococcaceae cyanobacterium]